VGPTTGTGNEKRRTSRKSIQQPLSSVPKVAVVEWFNCSIFLTFKPTTVHFGDNLLGNRTSNHDESSAESESDEEDVSLSSDDEHESDQGQKEFQNTSILSFVKNSVISWNVCRLANPQKEKNVSVWTWAGKGSEKWVKSLEMSLISYWKDFQCMEIMDVGSHMSLQSWGSKRQDQFYELGFVIFMSCWRPCWEKQLHFRWQRQVAVG